MHEFPLATKGMRAMELPLPEDMALTWGDLCAALADGELGSRRTAGFYAVRLLDIRRLERRQRAHRQVFDRRTDTVRSDAGIPA